MHTFDVAVKVEILLIIPGNVVTIYFSEFELESFFLFGYDLLYLLEEVSDHVSCASVASFELLLISPVLLHYLFHFLAVFVNLVHLGLPLLFHALEGLNHTCYTLRIPSIS